MIVRWLGFIVGIIGYTVAGTVSLLLAFFVFRYIQPESTVPVWLFFIIGVLILVGAIFASYRIAFKDADYVGKFLVPTSVQQVSIVIFVLFLLFIIALAMDLVHFPSML